MVLATPMILFVFAICLIIAAVIIGRARPVTKLEIGTSSKEISIEIQDLSDLKVKHLQKLIFIERDKSIKQ